MLQYILGSSGSGKSYYIYNKILLEAKENRDKNYIVIVPEQYTMATQRALVSMSENKSIMNIDVLSFERLAYRVFEELGMVADNILDDTGKTLVLRKIVSEKIDQLQALKKNMTRVGYITQVKSLISEMTQYNITPEILKEMIEYDAMSQNFKYKAKDLLVMYEAFLEYIKGKYITTESILSVLNDVLDDSKIVEDSVVVLDGFTGFTPIQYQLVKHLLQICQMVYVSMTISPDEKGSFEKKSCDELFAMSKDFIKKMDVMALEAKSEILDPIILSGKEGRLKDNDAIAFLEKNVFRKNNNVYEDAGSCAEIFCLSDPRDELRQVAIEITKLVKTNKYRYGDFAVVCPNLESYRYLVSSIWDAYQIPYFIDAKTEILFHPFIEAIDGLLDLIENDFKKEDLFRFLRSGYTDLSVEEIDILENYVYATNLKGSKKYFEAFAIKSEQFKEEDLIQLNEIRAKFVGPLKIFKEKTKGGKASVKEISQALYELFASFNTQEKILERGKVHEENGYAIKAKEYSQIFRIVMNLLDKMVAILGEENMTLTEYHEILSAGLSSAKIGVIPPANDSVVIGDIERTRLGDIKVLYLIGASDEAIPKKLDTGGILSQLERQQLLEKFDLAPSDKDKAFMQRFYLYLTLTKPTEKIVLMYPRIGGDGKSVRKSYLVDLIKKMFPDTPFTIVDERKGEDYLLSKAAAKDRMIALLNKSAERSKEQLEQEEFDELMALMAWYQTLDDIDIQSLLDVVFYEHKKETVSDDVILAINEAFNEDETITGSVSRFEGYTKCAYKYFLDYVLKLKKREEFSINPIDMGNFYHAALDNYGNALLADNIRWHDITDEQRDEYITRAINKTFEAMPKAHALDDPTQVFIIDEMKETLAMTVDVLKEQIQAGEFEPESFELKVSRQLMDEQGEIVANLKGKVDRVDTCVSPEDGSKKVRIIDYKSSDKDISLSDCYYGLSIQLPMYMGVVLEKLQEKYPSMHFDPSAMLYYSMKNPYVEKKEAIVEVHKQKLEKLRPAGLIEDSKENLILNDRALDTMDSYKSLTVPVSMNKNGVLSKSSSVAQMEDIDTILSFVNFNSAKKAKDIIDGKFDCRPYSPDGEKKECDKYCLYRSVCHFNENEKGYELNVMPKLSDDVAIQKMQEDMNHTKEGDETNEMD